MQPSVCKVISKKKHGAQATLPCDDVESALFQHRCCSFSTNKAFLSKVRTGEAREVRFETRTSRLDIKLSDNGRKATAERTGFQSLEMSLILPLGISEGFKPNSGVYHWTFEVDGEPKIGIIPVSFTESILPFSVHNGYFKLTSSKLIKDWNKEEHGDWNGYREAGEVDITCLSHPFLRDPSYTLSLHNESSPHTLSLILDTNIGLARFQVAGRPESEILVGPMNAVGEGRLVPAVQFESGELGSVSILSFNQLSAEEGAVIKCPHGCGWTGYPMHADQHLECFCELAPVPCANAGHGCTAVVPRRGMHAHLTTECAFHRCVCGTGFGSAAEKLAHMSTCEEYSRAATTFLPARDGPLPETFSLKEGGKIFTKQSIGENYNDDEFASAITNVRDGYLHGVFEWDLSINIGDATDTNFGVSQLYSLSSECWPQKCFVELFNTDFYGFGTYPMLQDDQTAEEWEIEDQPMRFTLRLDMEKRLISYTYTGCGDGDYREDVEEPYILSVPLPPTNFNPFTPWFETSRCDTEFTIVEHRVIVGYQ
eukprot:gnl/Dysnectes_brevis/6328_a9747_302.p1 GENE.gnl/Dysnectes_brevis/6328_a9747_302~~gnl/Dysnectes_brevis/6328_a9747_302.p1  ORF type:complete len:540 (+),score=89.48 gnl/Dysnectes_brevis/6328_a9747_302:15-1634(+)